MKKQVYIVALLYCSVLCVFAQNRLLSIKDATIGGYLYLKPKDIDQVQWLPDEEIFIYEKENAFFKYNVEEKKNDLLFALDIFNQVLKENEIQAIRFFPEITFYNSHVAHVCIENTLCVFDYSKYEFSKMVRLPENAENYDFDNTCQQLAFTVGNNLYLLNNKNIIIPITRDKNKSIKNGNTVHRVEFGIEKGTFWSPKSNYLAFYRKDETMVTDYPLVDVNTRIAELKNTKYPMAGMKSHEVILGIYSIKDSSTIFLQTGEPADQYLTNVCWSPDEKYIYIAALNRAQNVMKLNQYDARSGEFIKTLFTEEDDKYVEPLHPMMFLHSSPSKFIWQSRRDGFNHLYVYHMNGDFVTQLTSGEWEVTKVIQTDEKEEWIYVISTQENPIERHICKVNMKSGKMVKISHVKGVHEAFISKSGNYILDRYSSMQNPNQVDLLDNHGKVIKNFIASTNPLKDYQLGETKIGTILADDNKTSLYCKMIKPIHFNPQKKYPVILYVYGGPHAQLVLDSWYDATELWLQYMAQHGYMAFILDNRGSENRGLEFENVTFRQLGQVEMKDQMKGIEYLKSLPYVDAERIGVYGWSFGGYMTISLMLHYPEIFKAGVAGGPVTDWKYYEVMYGERYMDTPLENPEGYELTNLNNYVGNLQGRLLIIHGAMDSTVVWQHSLTFLNECVERGKLIDYFVYPNYDHNITGMDRIHLIRKVTRYFIDFL